MLPKLLHQSYLWLNMDHYIDSNIIVVHHKAKNLKRSLFIALLYLQQYPDTIGFKIGKPFINR
jgi:hypothetical protein